jgi:hypothetical protein
MYCAVGSGIRDEYFWDPDTRFGIKNVGIRIRDKTSRIRNIEVNTEL